MNHVLLGDANLIAYQLRNHRNMAGMLELTAFLPYQQRAGHRRTAGAVCESLQRQNIVIDHFTQKTQGEDFIGHADIGKDKAVGEKQKAARKFNALPFVPHILIADITAERRVIRIVARI